MSSSAIGIFGGVASKAGANGLSMAGVAAGPAGLIATAGVGVVSAIVGIVNHHAQAVKTEATGMNYAVPRFITNMQMIFAQLNAGQYGADVASVQIDSAVQDYYNNVASILKKSGSCGGSEDNCDQNKSGLDPCNAACSVGCEFIEKTACVAKRLLYTGGTVTIPAFGGVNSALLKQNSFVLNYRAGVGSVNYNTPSAGAPFGGESPTIVGQSGTTIANTGGVIPYSAASYAPLTLAAAKQTPFEQALSLVHVNSPQSNTGKIVLFGGGALLLVLIAIAATK